MRKPSKEESMDTGGESRVGGGGSGSRGLPGEVAFIIDAKRYICPEEGGHLVDRNPCPRHHGPTTLFGAE
jgi:hypothetical protein